jgi:hypothetical protein
MTSHANVSVTMEEKKTSREYIQLLQVLRAPAALCEKEWAAARQALELLKPVLLPEIVTYVLAPYLAPLLVTADLSGPLPAYIKPVRQYHRLGSAMIERVYENARLVRYHVSGLVDGSPLRRRLPDIVRDSVTVDETVGELSTGLALVSSATDETTTLESFDQKGERVAAVDLGAGVDTLRLFDNRATYIQMDEAKGQRFCCCTTLNVDGTSKHKAQIPAPDARDHDSCYFVGGCWATLPTRLSQTAGRNVFQLMQVATTPLDEKAPPVWTAVSLAYDATSVQPYVSLEAVQVGADRLCVSTPVGVLCYEFRDGIAREIWRKPQFHATAIQRLRSPSGKPLVLAAGPEIGVFDVEDGSEVASFSSDYTIDAVSERGVVFFRDPLKDDRELVHAARLFVQ